MLKLGADLFGVVQRFGFTRGDECGGQQRRAVDGQQLLQHLVVGHTQANGFALRVAQAARHFLAGFQDEGVGTGCGQLEQAELAVVHLGVTGQFAQVAAEQGEVVFVVHLADAAQLVGGIFVVEVADQRIAGVGGHGGHTTTVQQGSGLFQQARLRVVGVNFKVLGHGGDRSQVSVGSTGMRRSSTVSQAPAAPQAPTMAIPISAHWSGTWAKIR